MEYCIGTILNGQENISGRMIMLECKPIQPLINLYSRFGFSKIEEEEPSPNGLIQMIRILQPHELVSPPPDETIQRFFDK